MYSVGISGTVPGTWQVSLKCMSGLGCVSGVAQASPQKRRWWNLDVLIGRLWLRATVVCQLTCKTHTVMLTTHNELPHELRTWISGVQYDRGVISWFPLFFDKMIGRYSQITHSPLLQYQQYSDNHQHDENSRR